jgi:hypothetical protein
MELDVVRAHCPGKLKILEILDVGVTHTDSSSCYLTRDSQGRPALKAQDAPCVAELLWAEAKEKLGKRCIGEKSCEWSGLKEFFDPAGSCISTGLYEKRHLYL